MPRYAFLIEYDGTPFCGWQRQKDQPSVQGAIEAALDRLEPGLEALAAAGRTDTGVHAFGQVAHVDMRKSWDPFRLAEALNHHLKPAPVAIRKAAEVGDGFHARFSAVERRYLYRILNRRAPAVLSAQRTSTPTLACTVALITSMGILSAERSAQLGLGPRSRQRLRNTSRFL